MGTIVLTDARIEIDSNVISSDGNQVEISAEIDLQDDTAFGDTTRINKSGLKNWTFNVSVNQNFAAAAIDSILWGLFDAGAPVTFKVRPTSAVIGTSNPEYTAMGIISSYTPIGNSVGEGATASITMVPGGASPNLTRNTA